MHHHCLHSACQAWCLMTKEVKACPLFPRGNHISLHRLSKSSLPRYYSSSTICDRSDQRDKICHYYIKGFLLTSLLISNITLFIHCSQLTHTSMLARISTCKDSMSRRYALILLFVLCLGLL